MPGFAYLDASALVKLAVHEAETAALEHDVLDRDALFKSELCAIEFHRALGPTGQPATHDHADAVLEAISSPISRRPFDRRPDG